MKHGLLVIAEQILPLLEDKRQEMVARNRGIKAKEGESTVNPTPVRLRCLLAFMRPGSAQA
jgi:ParB family chromosome partitioning protein